MTLLSFKTAACAAALICSVTVASAQMAGSDLVVRLDRIENQMRQLTGLVEQLQFRNQQLEQQIRKQQDDNEYRFQELSSSRGAAPAAPGRAPAAPQQGRAPAAQATPAAPAATPGRRGDAFDPAQNPAAPGVPRTLGGGPGAAPLPPEQDSAAVVSDEPVGVPGGRTSGAPLDLSTLAGNASRDPALVPQVRTDAQGSRDPGRTQVATLPPTQSPRDEYDLGYGYVLRKDYALGEQTLRSFLKKYPGDKLAPEAEYWLGESLFQRQRYREAAEAFLKMSTNPKYEKEAKAPDSLLRLGQSLAALGEKETACAALGEVARKYPRAATGVKQGVEREQKRVKC